MTDELVASFSPDVQHKHRIPSWRALLRDPKLPKMKLLKWKLKMMATERIVGTGMQPDGCCLSADSLRQKFNRVWCLAIN